MLKTGIMKNILWLIFITIFMCYAVLHSIHFIEAYMVNRIDFFTLVSNLGAPIFITICSVYIILKKIKRNP